MIMIAMFGELGEWKYLKHTLGLYIIATLAIWSFSEFAAICMLVALMLMLAMIFVVTAFSLYSTASMIEWHALSTPRRFLILLAWFIPVFFLGLTDSAPLKGLAVFACMFGILGWSIRALFLYAIAMHNRNKREGNQQ
ncbi:hypothetical protein SAMN04487859_11599 [Roseovarius lutimaris]|uniref:Uncharacterized protein n=1 Tax=Roseovarius lutimaris TaxID=1005928 RepID=A0A1I5ECH4_9RHOB|nr:hypothetical protein [Roseovarius lutimaris]SFO09202.1 hypothetical protein SAMN04487859_11599 [Roseovarius lutimaris]